MVEEPQESAEIEAAELVTVQDEEEQELVPKRGAVSVVWKFLVSKNQALSRQLYSVNVVELKLSPEAATQVIYSTTLTANMC